MPGLIKHPEVRGAEFLDHTQALFFSNGYDSVRLDDVLASRLLSFVSVEGGMLEALVDRPARQILTTAEEKNGRTDESALERLNGFLARARRYKLDVASHQRSVRGSLGRVSRRRFWFSRNP